MLGVGGKASWVLGLRHGRQMSPQSWTPRAARCVGKMLVLDPGGGGRGTLVSDKLVDMVLGPVLAGGDFEDEGNDKQGLLGVPAGDHLGAG